MINYYSQKEVEIMAQGGKILNQILNQIVSQVKEGVTGQELEQRARQLIKVNQVKSSFLGHNGYPAVLCFSVNSELVHGLPDNYQIRKGDLVGLDLGIRFKGLCLDKAMTILVGNQKETRLAEAEPREKFLKTLQRALEAGISQAKPGNYLGDISFAIQKEIEGQGYSVIRALAGHGIGHQVHEDPSVPNFGQKGQGPLLKQGMVLAIEPMASFGQPEIETQKDGWTIVTKDGSLAGHFEETVALTKNGPWVLTS